jgi:plastocyanin
MLMPLAVAAISVGGDFTDVPPEAWFAPFISDALRSGIISGQKDSYGRLTGRFAPERTVTVGEALKMSIEAAGYDSSKALGYGHWAAKYLSIALGEQFLLASDPVLDLDRPATRAEVASLIADAFRVPMPTGQTQPFADVPSFSRFAPAINALASRSIIAGDGGGSLPLFHPDRTVNRAEAVKIVMSARSTLLRLRSFSSSAAVGSASSRSCVFSDCGYPPGMSNWQCPDGTVGGPVCEALPDGRCGWLVRQCYRSSSSRSGSSSSYPCAQISCIAPRQGCVYIDPIYDKRGCPVSCGIPQCSASSMSSRSSSSSAHQTYVLLYTENGFSPSTIRIRRGDTIVFKNITSSDVRVASNPHPAHTDYSGFDSVRTLLRDDEYAFTFTRSGTFGFHNHLHPEWGGQVVVE